MRTLDPKLKPETLALHGGQVSDPTTGARDQVLERHEPGERG